jgi:hypothetical protein
VETEKWFPKSELQLSELLRGRLSLFCGEALPVDDQAVLAACSFYVYCGNYDPYGLGLQCITLHARTEKCVDELR